MPDRVRESIFSILGTYYDCPGALPALHVADVFAGSGSLGIEALSRGAASCCFIERSPAAVATLRRNLARVRAADLATIVRGNAWRHIAATATGEPFSLIFLDPPYRDSQDTGQAGHVAQYMARMRQGAEPGLILVWHHHRDVTYGVGSPDGWRVITARIMGTNGVTILESTE